MESIFQGDSHHNGPPQEGGFKLECWNYVGANIALMHAPNLNIKDELKPTARNLWFFKKGQKAAKMTKSVSPTLNGNTHNQAKISSILQVTENQCFLLGCQALASRGSTKHKPKNLD
jgi:hypothetical protein